MLQPAIETLKAAGAPYEILPDGLDPEEVARRAADADVIIAAYLELPRRAISLLKQVGLIVRCGVGVDAIDVEAATEHGVWVANVPDYGIHEAADHAMLLLLAATRHLNHFQESWPVNGWASTQFPMIRRLRGQRLGIIGLGRIGSQVAIRARGFGLEVVATSPHLNEARVKELGVKGVPLDELLRTSDIISLHTPLTAKTTRLLDQAAFTKMRSGVIIVNTARGALIDLNALQAAIDNGTVAAVALDVLEREPYPDLSMPFLKNPNATITPHVAWYSEDAVRELGVLAAQEALRYLRGEQPRAVLNPEARSRANPV